MRTRIVLLIASAFLLSGCLADSTVRIINEEPQAGFFYGVLHGFLFYVHLFQHSAGNEVTVYDLLHNRFYDFGFISGLALASAAPFVSFNLLLRISLVEWGHGAFCSLAL